MLKAEDKFRAFVGAHIREIVLGALFLLSVLIRFDLAPRTRWSGDYIYCIVPWVNTYRELGFVQGLATAITNYYIPYNILLAFTALFPMEPWVLISLFSCIAEYVMVYYAYRILNHLSNGEHVFRAAFAAVSLLYLPPLILNGAFWKQCDAIYAAFGVIALYHLLKEQYYRAFWFLSIAFVFKLQIILLFPVFFYAYFCGKRYSVLYWLRIPLTYLEAGLPAILCGRPAAEVYSVYLNQSDEYHYMFLNTGNLYRLFRSDYEAVSNTAILLTIAFLAGVFLLVMLRRRAVDGRVLLRLAGLTACGCFLILPAMHERYDYLPIVLVSLDFAYYDRKKFYIPAAMVAVTTVMYCAYLFGGNTLPEEAYAMINIAAFVLLFKDTAGMLERRDIHVDTDQ